MSPTRASQRLSVVEAARAIHARGLAHGTAGNVSVRAADLPASAWVTPSAVPYAELAEKDVLRVALDDGRLLEGQESGRVPTSEVGMHLAILRARSDVHVVAHGHPANATGLAAAGRAIPEFLDEVAAFLGGGVEVSAYAPSGSPALGERIVEALGDRAAALIANHGAVAVGRDATEAVEALALVEFAASAYVAALAAGGPRLLPRDARARWRQYYLSGTRRY